MIDIGYGNALKFQTLAACQKRLKQTVQTKIRLLLKNQSDQGLPCLLFCDHFVNSSLENRKRKAFEILEHLP